ncbi:flippase [Devosia ginsengisoli]|uniref:flippase n=1 Tax=Devosia ginsengisoli TaxID=400770 RepID=UPI0016497857|nr:flippase [Devosia ginsengisoli]
MFRSRLAHIFAGTLLAGLVSRLLVLVMTIIMARQLSPDGYGVFTFATGTAMLIAQLAGMGWPALMSRLIPVFRIQQNWSALRALIRWGDAVVLMGSVAAFLIVLAAIFTPGFDQSLQAGLVLTLILIFPASLMVSRRAQLAGARRPAIGIIFAEALPAAAVILVALIGGLASALPAVATFGLAATVSAVLSTYVFRLAVPRETWQARPQGEPRAWMARALPLLLGNSSQQVMHRMDVVMLGPLSSLLEVGYFGAAFRLTYLMTFPQVVLMQVMTPLLSESIAARDEPAMWRHFRMAVIFSLVTVTPVSLLLGVCSEPIVTLIFGHDFLPSAAPLKVLAISQAFAALTIPCAGLLIAAGRGAIFGLINLVAVLANIGLNFVLIPPLGIMGAALASMGAVTLMFVWQASTIWHNKKSIMAGATLYAAAAVAKNTSATP